ncbi:hypothetical protein DdX_10822 [Ditylenchus destructor]|uniref:Uncharacterized protein n=1 Tax=Ditylenchus destructor TaxID=166010 RepID=A0AAD4MX70_9BILA|nr:hypothetical protein DdX_10822 [Ditylenchus destructor]
MSSPTTSSINANEDRRLEIADDDDATSKSSRENTSPFRSPSLSMSLRLRKRKVSYCEMDEVEQKVNEDRVAPIQLPPATTPTRDNSHPRQLLPVTTPTRDNSHPWHLPPATAPTRDSSHPRQLPPATAPTRDSSHPRQLPPLRKKRQLPPLGTYPRRLIPVWNNIKYLAQYKGNIAQQNPYINSLSQAMQHAFVKKIGDLSDPDWLKSTHFNVNVAVTAAFLDHIVHSQLAYLCDKIPAFDYEKMKQIIGQSPRITSTKRTMFP